MCVPLRVTLIHLSVLANYTKINTLRNTITCELVQEAVANFKLLLRIFFPVLVGLRGGVTPTTLPCSHSPHNALQSPGGLAGTCYHPCPVLIT